MHGPFLRVVQSNVTWRAGVAAFLCLAFARSFFGHEGALNQALTLAQFAIVGVLTAAMLTMPAGSTLRQWERRALFALAACVVVSAMSVTTSSLPAYSLAQVAIFGLMVSFLTVTSTRRWHSREVISGDLAFIFLAVCAAQGIGLLAYALGAEWASGGYDRFTGLFSNANYAGMAVAIVAPLVIYLATDRRPWQRAILWIGFAVLAGALIGSLSRGAMIACVLGVVVALVLRIRRRWFTLLALGLGVAFAFGSAIALFALRSELVDTTLDSDAGDPTSGRLALYTKLLAIWVENPILGVGYRSTSEITGGLQAHNVFLSVLVETGAVGIVAFLAFLAFIVFSGPRDINASPVAGALLAIIVSEMTESSLFGWSSPTALLAWLIILAFAALGRFEDTRSVRVQHSLSSSDATNTTLQRLKRKMVSGKR